MTHVALAATGVDWKPVWHLREDDVELGPDMSVLPSDRHRAGWAKLCPGAEQSAGTRRSGSTGTGNQWLRECLIECARSAVLARDG